MPTARPLDGVTVLALEHAIAAPLCTRQLAELGARVIKVERREGGDFARAYDGRVKGLSSHFVWTNRSKESLTLDLKHPRAQEILGRLLERSDVLVQNLAPGAAARLGLAYEALRHTHPRLVVCDISGYGSAGPYRDRKAYDLLIQSEAGFLSVTGNGDALAKSGISIADIAAGTQAYGGILAALLQRTSTGTGSHVEVSLLESLVEWMGFPLYFAYDDASPPPRTGTDHASIYPYGAFPVGDGQAIMLGLQNEREWLVFCRDVLQQEHLARDPRFASNRFRSEARDALRGIIVDCFRSLGLAEVRSRLDRARIAWADVNDMAAVWRHPQLAALDRLVEIETPAGPVRAFRPPGSNSGFEHRLAGVPSLGQHTRAILGELGYSGGEIEALVADQAV